MFTCAGGHSGPPLRRGFVSLGGKSNIDRRRLPTPGGIGTHGIHPPRKRTPITASQASRQNPIVIFACAGGHSGPPLRGGLVSIKAIIKAGPKQNSRFVTPGGIGTHAMHPLRKRTDMHSHYKRAVRRGQALKPAHTGPYG